MASKINADEFVDREGEGKPTLPKGVVLSGVTTITTAVVAENEVANSTGINAGIITSTHFKGNLTGDVNAGIVTVTSQTVVGSAVTISASGIDIGAGVITATSYAGSGANLTGIGATIMVWEYNPDPGDMMVPFASGIGITFNQKIKAGSGNITLREDSASGTVVENFGIGSSVTISGNSLSMTPTSDLSELQNYHLSYPSGVITNMAGESYVGTAYTFKSLAYDYQLWMWGRNTPGGGLGQNNTVSYSSPVQVPGTNWKQVQTVNYQSRALATKTDGTLWSWGYNNYGGLGQNNRTNYSSPIQIPGTTWKNIGGYSFGQATVTKTDGTLWTWGSNSYGILGTNQPDNVSYSSPVQVPGTTWDKPVAGYNSRGAIKTDGTLWMWARNHRGQLGLNDTTNRSSPVQLPGTTWSDFQGSTGGQIAVKTDGTLWAWGEDANGEFGIPSLGHGAMRSSPTQVPGTNWSTIISKGYRCTAAIKTDGTLWAWGRNFYGSLGQNDRTERSSPVQIPGTTWSFIASTHTDAFYATKTDGTFWTWGYDSYGKLGHNTRDVNRSSPTQIPGTDWITGSGYWGNKSIEGADSVGVIKRITP